MKKFAIIFGLIFLLGATSPASASLGFFKPSSKLYFLQPAFESIRLFFTFSKEAKADYLMELAQRRVEEMSVSPSNAIASRYAEHFKQLNELAKQVPEEKKEQIVEKIKEASLRQQEVLTKVYNQVPEEAQTAILNAQENSLKHVEKTIEAVQGLEKAQEYITQAEQIRQIERIQKQEQIQPAPMEENPNAEPGKAIPKELNELKEIKPGQELKPLLPEQPSGQGTGGGRIEPAPPVQMQPPAERQ